MNDSKEYKTVNTYTPLADVNQGFKATNSLNIYEMRHSFVA